MVPTNDPPADGGTSTLAEHAREAELSIVVPTRNESANVGPLFARIEAALAGSGTDFEVCFVDDSSDNTVAVLADLERLNPGRIRCRFRQGAERSGGLATAVVTGLRLAQGTYVCVMDADLQHRPETIPAMLAAAREGADLVVASRYTGSGSNRGLDGLSRRLVSRGCGLVARVLFSEARRTTDPLSGFFLCRRELIDGIEFRPVGFKILLELLVCLPGLQVRDVSLDFAARESGSSKASARQGLIFLRHLASLFLQVEGSARFWKFGVVGLSGLGIFLGLLAILTGPLHWAPLAAFWPAFAPSVVWNTAINGVWTFADVRHRFGRGDSRGYLLRALVAGIVTFAGFSGLIAAGLQTVLAGVAAALAAMVINGLTNRRAVDRQPAPWAGIAADRRVTVALNQVAARLGGDRAYLLPPRASAEPTSLPRGLVARVIDLRRPALWTEAVSHRPQRRTNIDVTSTLLLPIVNGPDVIGVVVVERRAPHGFAAGALELAAQAMESLVPAIAEATGVPQARRIDRTTGEAARGTESVA